MHLPALTIGCAVPATDFDATIHSVFHSAVNLRSAKRDLLLTLVASDEADLPQGIRVDTPTGFSFEIFHAGEQVTCRDGMLRILSLTIDLRGARRWKCDLPSLQADTTDPAVSIAWSFVWNTLNQRQIQSNAEIVADVRSPRHHPTNLYSSKAGEALHDLINAARRYDFTDNSAVEALIGLGSGLTPCGDDLLVGYVAGLWCAVQDKSERMQFVTNLGTEVIGLSHRTNDISRTYLYYASQGQVSSLLANLAEAICRGEKPDRLAAVAESAMRVGHTSGMDAVTGLLLGLATWMPPGSPVLALSPITLDVIFSEE